MVCFRKIPFEKNLLDTLGRGLGKEGVSRFFVEMFVSRSTERLPWGTLLSCVSEKYPSRKNLWIKWDGGWGGTEYHVFLLKLFFLSLPKKCAVEPFSVSLILCSETFCV